MTTAPGFDNDYFPARLNAPLKAGRYKIRRKLGEGVSSSSWIVYDEDGERGYKYLAAKILTVDATKRHGTGQMRELEFMKEIRGWKDSDHLPLLRDHFVERGPRGEHLCLVMDLYSTSVSALRRSAPHKALPPYMTRNIIMMLVEALVQLHSMRIVHTDVKLDNLLFGNSLYYWEEDLDRFLEANPAETDGSFELDGESYPLLKSQPIPHGYSWDTNAFEAELMLIYLVDYGQAQRAGEQPTTDCFSAYALRAPKLFSSLTLGQDWTSGPSAALYAPTFELLVGRWLFHPEEGEDWSVEDDHLAKMMEMTGQRFPAPMLERAKRRKEFFDDDGNLLRISELIPSSLETAMANYKVPGLSEDEIKKAADFIRACLRFDYSERATAEELQDHAFLADAFKC
ncbi:kinase-like domain-containing protein [Fomitopsis serialis]|uniref:kinase-like domain-containing protein n=1 Tax=Fomitopsis serialis TaxID=139415 RepID=UPI0020086E98|nr:kinase-like domain-containing protein [Neoantrodia serialis]KAH9929341.1 kinase-like domain-containing protein [Neoantrodia serialis]